jgi:hypothetical protein
VSRRARAAGICALCSGPVRVGDAVRACHWIGPFFPDAHLTCYEKDAELAGDAAGATGSAASA